MKILLLLLFSITLASCGLPVAPELRPANRLFSHMPKDGSAEYSQGWTEGCESGMSGMSNSFYSSFYYFKQDKDLLKNEVYYKAWKDSYDYCKGYIYGMLKEANMRRPLANKWGTGDMMGRQRSGMMTWFENIGPSSLFRW